MDTIFAQCSAKGKAGVAIFRISGSKAIEALEQLMQADTSGMLPRTMYLRKIYTPSSQNQIDEVMVVYFQSKSSFTGEESVEIHTHGSIAVMKLLNMALLEMKFLRLAEPGEFARRAFLNGRFDLTAAEGLADLIDAETHLQHKQAIRQMGGGLQQIYDKWREQLLKLMSLLEAYIDFPDEEIPEKVLSDTQNMVKNLISEIKNHLDDNNRGERLRNGLKMAIIGRPNVGKSSLLNYLLKREIAIVSEIAGTTRDVIEGHLDIGGYPIILQDTAGIHDKTTDLIEQEGIKRAKQICRDADIKIIMFDASDLQAGGEFKELIDKDSILLANKIDVNSDLLTELPERINNVELTGISLKTKSGLDKLPAKITTIAQQIANPAEIPQITRERHRAYLNNALEYLSNFSLDNDLVLAAEDLRMAIRAISSITGRITVDEILGEIFSNFCIGK